MGSPQIFFRTYPKLVRLSGQPCFRIFQGLRSSLPVYHPSINGRAVQSHGRRFLRPWISGRSCEYYYIMILLACLFHSAIPKLGLHSQQQEQRTGRPWYDVALPVSSSVGRESISHLQPSSISVFDSIAAGHTASSVSCLCDRAIDGLCHGCVTGTVLYRVHVFVQMSDVCISHLSSCHVQTGGSPSRSLESLDGRLAWQATLTAGQAGRPGGVSIISRARVAWIFDH
jgi:hypothetical protein